MASNYLKPLLALAGACALLAMSCSGSKTFDVEGQVAGNANMNLYVKYFGNGRVNSALALAREGQFAFKGASASPAYMEISDNEGRPLAYLCIADGDKARITIERSNPFKMQAAGTPALEEWTHVANANADVLLNGPDSAANALIEQYVLANPQSMASAMLLLTAYRTDANPVMADSLARSIAPEARPDGVFDSYVTILSPYSSPSYTEPVDTLWYRTAKSRDAQAYTPADHELTLLVLSNDQYRTFRRDTLVPALKLAAKDKKLQIVDLVLSTDTSNFKSATRADSATWIQGWAPGGIYARGIDRLSIPQLPYYIVLDSAGRQTRRTPILDQALRQITR